MLKVKFIHKKYIANTLMAVIGAILLISIFGQMSFHIEALEFSIKLEIFDHGLTELMIPPIGKISAKTHDTPLKFAITLKNIDMELVKKLFNESIEQQSLINKTQQELTKVIKFFVLRILLLAALGGMFGIFLLRRKKPVTYIRGAIVGTILMGLLLLGTYNTYDTDSFLTPKYEGILRAAPWMIGLAEEAIGKLDKLGDQMQVMANNLYVLFEKIDTLKPLNNNKDTFRLLHISDIHNNPAGYDFVQQIVQNFNVAAILDTGDISDFGTPLEAQLIKRLEGLGIPYIFTSGNHDSPDIVTAMRAVPNVIVLDGDAIDLYGLRILGIGDPAATTSNITPPDIELAGIYIQEIQQIIVKDKKKIDVLMVHNPGIARHFSGKFPVILHGHDHQIKIVEDKNTHIFDAGTSGAAGIRGLQTVNEIPYSVILLHFRKGSDSIKLVAADSIKVYNLKSGFNLERTLFEPQEEKKELDKTE